MTPPAKSPRFGISPSFKLLRHFLNIAFHAIDSEPRLYYRRIVTINSHCEWLASKKFRASPQIKRGLAAASRGMQHLPHLTEQEPITN